MHLKSLLTFLLIIGVIGVGALIETIIFMIATHEKKDKEK